MVRKLKAGIILSVLLVMTGVAMGQSDLCNTVDMKPVLSLQQVNQAEFVHYLVVLSGIDVPPPEGKTPEEYYKIEVQALLDAGYPPGLADIEPDRLVTRRYFASMMFPIACMADEEFNKKYGDLTDETEQLRALVDSDWLYAEEGRLYREEMLSVLCTKKLPAEQKPAFAVDIIPVQIDEANLDIELPLSPQ